MSYYAQFDSHSDSGATFRSDTRIYLKGVPRHQSDGTCVAAIIGKNPGAASSSRVGVWESLNLTGDQTLPRVRNVFMDAYKRAGKLMQENDFVQVWNLFYLCDKDLDGAIAAIKGIDSPLVCSTEKCLPKIVWFAWGGSHKHLNPFKTRFLTIRPVHAFFFDKEKNDICSQKPTTASFAKHPIGLFLEPIIKHLADIL